MPNNKQFNLKLSYQKAFSLIVTGINLLFNWFQNIPIVSTFLVHAHALYSYAKNISIESSIGAYLKQTSKIFFEIDSNLSLQINKILSSAKLYSNNSMLLVFQVIYMKALLAIYSSIQNTISIVARATIAIFVKLGTYDPLTLGDMDTVTLGELDSAVLLGNVLISIPNGVVTLTLHELSSGYGIYFTTTGSLPTPLVQNVTYYVIADNPNSFKLATSHANAVAPIPIAITTSGTQSGIHTCYLKTM